jgi:hypothetical protein
MAEEEGGFQMFSTSKSELVPLREEAEFPTF